LTTNVVLRTEGLTKRYGELTAVDHLSLEVYQGEVFGLLGPNGAGKTTSINLMCGLMKPDAGQVYIHGNAVSHAKSELKARVGACPQEVIIWERLTCLEQLEFMGQMYGVSSKEVRARVDWLLEEMGLNEKRNKQARTLSGGMRQRLNLIMALVHDPEIVVLDEPEAGLDPQSRVKVRTYIQSLAKQKTIILTTHNMDEAERLVDRVAIIDHGKLLVLDTPEALKQRIGEGDVVEIELESVSGIPLEDAAIAVQSSNQFQDILSIIENKVPGATVRFSSDTITIQALDALGILPVLLETLKKNGIEPGEVHLRENTLEDVFLELTGRRMRE
jgi:ABC-2 type transport system ATP-binding protein